MLASDGGVKVVAKSPTRRVDTMPSAEEACDTNVQRGRITTLRCMLGRCRSGRCSVVLGEGSESVVR